ncbi:MAG: glycosyltransferase family 2 protein [Verrucomicrobia bacterium]|nr:glycosyltransferase family 2 protein [Verrucomicrobiota bacterium]MBU1734782.1 glycosyltransferase family 2 protein [Verrucomicrobiota bacterium]MBU1857801.1 glycosyltransferase family 2 protein [Verrucomicrobiota bacterium]
MNAPPELSIVIPTLGRPILIRTLQSLVRADGFGRLDIMVAGQITDALVRKAVQDLSVQYPNIRHLEVSFPRGDSSEKKNAGWRAAKYDLIAFIDDDVVVARNWPEKIRAPFQQPDVGLVSGPGLVPDDIALMARLAGNALASKAAGYVAGRYLAGNPEPRKIRWSSLIGCNMAYRRSVLEQLGGFDPAFWPGEEMIAAFQATQLGHKLIFQPNAILYHYPRSSFWRFCRQIYGYGATRIRLIRAGVDVELTTIIPAVGLLALVVLGIVAVFCRWAGFLLLAGLALYALADFWATLAKYRETRRWVDLLIFFLIPIMHLSYGLAEWVELVRPGKDLSETLHSKARDKTASM